MAKVLVIVAATAMEMRSLMQGLHLDRPIPEAGYTVSAEVRDIPLRLAVSGVGPLAAAATAGRLCGEGTLLPEHCRGLLVCGIAGTYARTAAPIGSVVLANKEIWPEYGLYGPNGIDPVALGFPLAGKKEDTAPPPVWNSLPLCPAEALAAMGLNDPVTMPWETDTLPVTTGVSITVAGVSGTKARAGELAARHAGVIENMEGFPLALVARQVGVPFAEIRSVSNLVGERGADAWDIPAALAALSRVISMVFSL